MRQSIDGLYKLDGLLYDNLKFASEAVRKDDDFILLIDGMERSGKSVLAQQIARFFDPEFDVSKIVFTVDDFLDTVKNADQYTCIIWDEAFRGLSKRQAISKVNKKVVQTLMEVGQRNLFIIIVLPTYFELDKYAALHRCKCLIHVHRDKHYRRGYFKFFDYKKMKSMYVRGRQEYKYCSTCNFYGSFSNHYTVDENDYKTKKDEALRNSEIDQEPRVPRAIRQRDIVLAAFNNYAFSNVKKLKKHLETNYPNFDMSYRQMTKKIQEQAFGPMPL
jgi:hypothetical protein